MEFCLCVLIPMLLNNPFTSCSLINFDFLAPHTAHFDYIIVLPLLVFETTGLVLSVFFLHFRQQDSIVLYLMPIFKIV